jgi:two-component system sensor histidine kinase UhpB
MSLKLRLIVSIAASLLLALFLGGAALTLSARAAVKDEVQSAFQGARDEVRDTLIGDVQHTVTMRQVIAGFDGQRHVRAALLNEENNVIVASRLAPVRGQAPAWFAALIAPPPLTARIAIPLQGFPCILLLASDSTNEVGEIWQLARDAFAAMALFSATTLLFVWLIIGRSLRFFRHFRSGLSTISDGDYDARLNAGGPPEFAALADGFNHMAARLSSYRQRNRRLEQQILTLQEEERAEIARDLHDEVGPYLFAIQVDADAVAKSGEEKTRARAGAIRDAALHIQRHVKHILRQLKPVSGLDFGLQTAIDDVIAFWKRRHPEIRFERGIDFGITLDRRGEETVYRIVQESVSNAVRHGQPTTIRILFRADKDGVTLSVEDDGNGFSTVQSQSGMGLKGMAERVRALSGQVTVENRDRGVRICAQWPRARLRDMADA